MGFFSKVFGAKQQATALPRQMSAEPVPAQRAPQGESHGAPLPYHLVADSMLAVVGEAHYQRALRGAAGGRSSEDGITVQACISREPRNKYDKNAVRISVDGETVGYIARELAPLMRARLQWIESQGQVATCPARILGGSRAKPHYGIVLHCSQALNGYANERPAEPLVLLPGNWITTVTGEEHHQEILDRYAPEQPDQAVYIYATLGWCEVVKGKYRGTQAIEVRVDGQRVGQLTHAMTERYERDIEPLLRDDRLTIGAAAMLMRKEKTEVALLLPQHR